MLPTLVMVRLALYLFALLFSMVVFSLTIVRLNYTDRRRDPLIDPLRGGQAFYDPPIPELLVASFLTMCFALWMMFVIYRRYGHRILTKTWFELLWLFILWGLWLGGAASAAALWPNLNWCQIYKPCRILVALMAFAWMGFIILTFLMVGTLFVASTRGGWYDHTHSEWSFDTRGDGLQNGQGTKHLPDSGISAYGHHNKTIEGPTPR
ncbi:MARVEL domain-containing protein [Rhizoctonia solani AG-1 IA]|uniref:MARVEL domain-containing protein n=1 Tax=Thanatephorus cucumeris (strain AG1-IA) TaxID=983506 RepID=L8WZ94_THACA|nr:MARVEL domain-containing protein [Rhizoctonia solani AG-1 IA]